MFDYEECIDGKNHAKQMAKPIARKETYMASLINIASISNNIRALDSKKRHIGLSPIEDNQRSLLGELLSLQTIFKKAISSICPPGIRTEVESALICKYLELRGNGALPSIPPASYIYNTVKTLAQNETRRMNRCHGILKVRQTKHPIVVDQQVEVVTLRTADCSVSYDYADSRFSSVAIDSWLDNFDLVKGYCDALAGQFDKYVLWALFHLKLKPRDIAAHLNCSRAQVYSAIQRIHLVAQRHRGRPLPLIQQ